jgi:hypothetical protein
MAGNIQLIFSVRRLRITCFGLLLILAFIFLTGCGGKSGSSLASGAGNGASKANDGIGLSNEGSVQLRIGDDPTTPDGRIVTLRLDITSMRLWNSSTSDAIDFLVDPVSVELTHSSTITIPIAESGANPNTVYDRLDITYSGSALSYMDMPSTTIYNQELGPLPDQTVDLSATPVTLGSDPVVINVSVNVPSMVTLPPVGATTVGANPVVRMANGLRVVNLPPRLSAGVTARGRVSARPMASGAGLNGSPLVTVSQSGIQTSQQQPQSGQIQHLIGPVTKVVGNAITIQPTGNSSFTFQTGSGTDFEDVTLGTALNATVEINGSTQSDGSLYADEVELVDTANGVELIGMVTSSYPDLTLSLVVQDGIGAGMSTSLVGKTINSQLDQASYVVDSGNIDMTGVTAVFDGEHVFPGQQVELESFIALQTDPDGSSGLTIPFMVELEQQTISGSAANYTAGPSGTGTFDVNLPLDGSSPVANLNPGLTSVHVYQQTTTFPSLSSLKKGTNIQVRGMLLCQNDNVNQTCTNFVMVAAKITVNN